MAGYVKLHSSILRSTIWLARPDREVFLTALLLAEPRELTEDTPQLHCDRLEETGWMVPAGWYGFCEASGPGIVHLSGTDAAEGIEALKRLGQPEPESRSQTFDGRRVVRVDHGYVVLNYMEYREKDCTNAERQRRYREKRKADSNAVIRPRNAVTRSSVTHADADADADIIDPCSSNEDLPSHAPPNGSLAAAAAHAVETNPSAAPPASLLTLESGVGISEAPTASAPAPEPEDSSPARAITSGLPSPDEVQAQTWPLTERFAQHLAELRGLTACPLSRPKRENRDRFEWLLAQIGVAEAAKAAWDDWQEATSRGEKVTSLGFFLRLLELRSASPPRTKSKPLSNCEPWADILERYRANGNRDTAEYLAKWVSPRVEEQILLLEVSDQAFADYVERYLPDIESEALEHHGLTVHLRLNRQSGDEAAAGDAL